MDILDAKIADAYAKAVAGEASDAEWIILLLNRQCGKLDAIHEDIREIAVKVDALDDARRSVKRWWAAVFGGFSLLAVGVGAGVRELLEVVLR